MRLLGEPMQTYDHDPEGKLANMLSMEAWDKNIEPILLVEQRLREGFIRFDMERGKFEPAYSLTDYRKIDRQILQHLVVSARSVSFLADHLDYPSRPYDLSGNGAKAKSNPEFIAYRLSVLGDIGVCQSGDLDVWDMRVRCSKEYIRETIDVAIILAMDAGIHRLRDIAHHVDKNANSPEISAYADILFDPPCFPRFIKWRIDGLKKDGIIKYEHSRKAWRIAGLRQASG